MSTENEDLEIVIEQEEAAPAEPEIEIKNPEEPKPEAKAEKPKEIAPEEGLDELRRSLDAEKAEKTRLARERDDALNRERQAQGKVQDASLAAISSAIETIKQQQEGQKARYAEAMASQDYTLAAEVQLEMSTSAARLNQAEGYKQAIENAPKPKTVEQPRDPVDTLASQLSPRSAAWVRSHPEYARDERLYRRMLAAHNLAETDGLSVDTDDYFSHIEKTLGIAAQEPAPQSTPARKAAPPAAPVSRGGTPAAPNRNAVTLTPAEVEIARLTFPDDPDPVKTYAKNKLALQRDGLLH